MTALAPERQFPIYDRGESRELLLGLYRSSLYGKINPDTGQVFTPEEIATATARESSKAIEADGLDLLLLSAQQRGLWLADQVRPDRASTASLKNLWGPLWLPEGYLQAAGGSGLVDTEATVGTVWSGSTTVPDPTAVYGTDPAGKRYQVLFDATTPGSGTVRLTVVGVDTGPETNLDADTEITWVNPPVSATGPGTVVAKFTGGLPSENDAAFAKRLIFRIRHKPAAGNNAQFVEWAKTSDNNAAVDTAFVYACALHAGTVRIAVLSARSDTVGPLARVASVGTIAQVTSYLVPPGSPVVPTPPFVVVTGVDPEPSDVVLSLSMPVGNPAGWEDIVPWPRNLSGTASTVVAVTDQTHFRISSGASLPTGVTAPSMMIWDEDRSRYEKLEVLSVSYVSGTTYAVVLAAAPTMTIAFGDYVSPYAQRADIIAETIEEYFDSLGPGELIDLAANDPRAHRAFRFPVPSEEYPQLAGSAVVSFLQDAMGASLVLVILQSISVVAPTLPDDPIDPPSLIVCGKVGVYSI